MPFKEYDQLFEPLRLPINGKVYEIPEIGIADGIRLDAETDPETSQQMTSEELRHIVLGTAYDEMIADNVPVGSVQRALLTGLADIRQGRELAQLMWESGGDPKAAAQSLKSQGNRASRRSKNTGAANSTPSPVSTSGTRPRKK